MSQDYRAKIVDEVLSLSPRPAWVTDLLAKFGPYQAVPYGPVSTPSFILTRLPGKDEWIDE